MLHVVREVPVANVLHTGAGRLCLTWTAQEFAWHVAASGFPTVSHF